jgi:hypothetical protein
MESLRVVAVNTLRSNLMLMLRVAENVGAHPEYFTTRPSSRAIENIKDVLVDTLAGLEMVGDKDHLGKLIGPFREIRQDLHRIHEATHKLTNEQHITPSAEGKLVHFGIESLCTMAHLVDKSFEATIEVFIFDGNMPEDEKKEYVREANQPSIRMIDASNMPDMLRRLLGGQAPEGD